MKNVLPLAGALLLMSYPAFAQEPPAAEPWVQPEPAPASPSAPPPSAPPGNYGAPPQVLYLPPPYPPAEPRMKRRSTGMFIAGIIMSGLGAASAAAGAVEFVAAEELCGLGTTSSTAFTRDTCVDTYKVVGVAGMVLGGVLVAVGLPLAIVGGTKVPVADRVPSTGALSLGVGPRSTNLTVSF